MDSEHRASKSFQNCAPQHSLTIGQDTLQMYLGGPGGTGKSRVINALKDYFELQNQS